MEWKHGRSGARTGRTLGSRFTQSRGNRSEGLLIHSSVVSCSSKGDQGEGEVVTYSLGKQNRWLLPEIIKSNSAGIEDREEVVLVERYTNVGNTKRGRPDCISVFNSKNGTIRKPKRKLAHAKDLLGDSEEVKGRYEVAYPHPSGSRLKSNKRPAGHLGKRKKNSGTSSFFEDDYDDDLGEIDYSDSEGEEDFSEQIMDNSSRLELDVLISRSLSKTALEAHAGEMSTSNNMKCTQHEERQLEGKCIYVDSDEEMEEQHLELLAQIKAGCSLLDARDQIKKNQSLKPKKEKNRCRARNLDAESTIESVPVVETCSFPLEPVHRDGCEGVVIKLRSQEITPAALTEQWGHMYKEGASYPRAFVLNLMPLISLSNSKEAFIVFRVFEGHARCNPSEAKAFVSLVVCNDESNTEKTLTDFIYQIKHRSAEQEIWSLEDIANVAICFLEGDFNNVNGKADYREPREPRLSLDVFNNLFGWKSRTFSSQAAKQQVKKCHAKFNNIATPVAAITDGNNQRILECEICFQDIMDKGELFHM